MRKKRELFFGIAAAMVFAASMSVYAEQEEETQGDTQMQTESLVASADEMAAPVDVVEADMEAVYGDEVKDGVYTIDVSSSSSMFKITDCSLTVDEEEMTAVITLGGDGY